MKDPNALWARMSPRERAAWLEGAGAKAPDVHGVQRVLATGGARVERDAPVRSQAVLSWSADNGCAENVSLQIGPYVLDFTGSNPGFIQGWVPALQGNGVEFPASETCLKLEYGSGTSSLVAKFDIRTGSYKLPPVSWVRLSLDADQPALAPAVRITATLVSGESGQSDVPTYTMVSLISGGQYLFPAQARAVEILGQGRMSWPVPSAQVTVIQESTAPTPVVSPPWAPVRLPLSSTRDRFLWTNEPTQGLPSTLVFSLDL